MAAESDFFVYWTKQRCINCKEREDSIVKKSTRNKVMTSFGLMMCLFGSLTGCGNKNFSSEQDIMQTVIEENKAARAASETEGQMQTELTGVITMAGSTSMERFANALAESFMVKYPGVTVTVEFTGSSAGIASVLAGSVDIGNSSRTLKDEEKTSGAVENIVAIESIVVITDKTNTTTDLGTDQLVGIYQGGIRNWSEVGGDDEPIVVVGREAGSGTRDAFEELLGSEDTCAYANELSSTGAVMAKVAATPGAIGYVSPDVLDDTVQILSLDGIEPTEENIKAGRYLLCRPFVMVTNGEIAKQNEVVQELFAYLKSEEGQELIKAVELIIPD